MNFYLITLFCIALTIPLFYGMVWISKYVKIEKWQVVVLVALGMAIEGLILDNPYIAVMSIFMAGVAVIRMGFK